MKTSVHQNVLRLVWLVLGLTTVSCPAMPWILRQQQTGEEYQSGFDTWTAPPYGYRLVRQSGSQTNNTARYTSLYEKTDKTTAWVARSGRSAEDFTALHDEYHAAGFRLVWLDAFEVNGEARYNGIWEQNGGPAQRVRLTDSIAVHQFADNLNQAAGFRLLDVSSYSLNGVARHAAVWQRGTTAETQVRQELTHAQYQSAFEEMGAAGYTLWRADGYAVNGSQRFTGVWRKAGIGAYWTFHGLSATAFEAEHINAEYQGFRPYAVDVYNIGGQTRYNATWVRNGGFSLSRLSQIGTAVTEYMQQRNLPGLSLAIMREGRLVYARGFGLADQENNLPAHALHRWRIASVSKPVCAVTVLRALEDSPQWSLGSRCFGPGGLFGNDFGDPVNKPYNTNEKNITIRHLLTMTAGWGTDGKLWYNDEPSYGTNHGKIIDYQMDTFDPAFAPNTRYRYSNFNYLVAARVPEKISGKSFFSYAKDQVFTPCGMTSMALGGRTAADRLINEVAYYEGDVYGNPEEVWPARMDGSTAWVCQPKDLLLLARRIDGNPRHRDILGAYALGQMQTASGVDDENGNPSGYGLGWYSSSRKGKTWWQHNGAMHGTQAILCVSDDGSQAFAYAANSVNDADRGSGTFRNMIIDLMAEIDNANAWPAINLFRTYNPEYDAWAGASFGNNVITQPGLAEVWAPEGDPDNDGRTNAIEAYLGSDPLSADRVSWFSTHLTEDHLVLRWTRKNGARGVDITPQFSLNLENWIDSSGGVVPNPLLIPLPPNSMVEEARLPRKLLNHTLGSVYGRLQFDVR